MEGRWAGKASHVRSGHGRQADKVWPWAAWASSLPPSCLQPLTRLRYNDTLILSLQTTHNLTWHTLTRALCGWHASLRDTSCILWDANILMKISVWYPTPCSLVEQYLYSGETFFLHQGKTGGHQASPQRCISTRLHWATIHMTPTAPLLHLPQYEVREVPEDGLQRQWPNPCFSSPGMALCHCCLSTRWILSLNISHPQDFTTVLTVTQPTNMKRLHVKYGCFRASIKTTPWRQDGSAAISPHFLNTDNGIESHH
jgi:hypothetical protein